VVSTLHTNSSVGTISRLEDMGIESYLLADSMIGVIAQRLVRRLCPYCKKEHLAEPDEKELMGIELTKDFTIYEPVGCERCDNTGYNGRIGIYEIMTITSRLKNMIAKNVTADELKAAAQAEGMHTLRESAIRLVMEGTTSYREMLRTTFEN
jgi:type IV pilus assembly protein PilB